MRDTARAFWVTAPGRGEIQDVTVASPREDEILVRTRFSGVSRGTEALVFAGRVPRSEWTRMRAPFQEGVFPAPVKYGYMNVGVVEIGPARLRGRLVFVLFPHQTHYVVPASSAHPVPEDLPARRAVLAANMETAVNGLWDARPHVGDRIVVVGAGAVGCLVAWLASRVAGCAGSAGRRERLPRGSGARARRRVRDALEGRGRRQSRSCTRAGRSRASRWRFASRRSRPPWSR